MFRPESVLKTGYSRAQKAIAARRFPTARPRFPAIYLFVDLSSGLLCAIGLTRLGRLFRSLRGQALGLGQGVLLLKIIGPDDIPDQLGKHAPLLKRAADGL